MPRALRNYPPGTCLHIIQCGNNRCVCTSAWVHRRHGSTGTLWDGRYHASYIDTGAYLLTCQRYIELNPVRAGMVDFPGSYRWSSYRSNAEGKIDPVLTPHALYESLGADAAGRCMAYQQLFQIPLAEKDLHRIRFALQNDFALKP